MSSAPKYQPHYTVEDYRHWEGEWELWDGTAVSMSPSGFGAHASVHGQIATALCNALNDADCKASMLVEIDWLVSHDTVLRPDITVVRGDVPEKHVESAPAIVVEVLSPSTRERDEVYKRSMYQRQGVGWYLMVDPESQAITALRLEGNEYEDVEAGESLEIEVCGTCSLSVRLDRVFR